MIEHTSIVNLIQCLNANHPLFVDEQVTFFCAYVFDVSVAEIFNAITQGATLHILSELCRTDATILSNYLLEYGICQCYLPPSILSLLPTVDYSKLRAILYAGEPCNPQTASHWSKVSSLCNYYGPTETTVYATRKDINRDEVEQIGRPIQNVKTYILNQNLHVVDIGEQGELYIGGVGLARGYLNL
ncbi:AMP-binding protein, partial [Fangia hongkongensis]|uniref:AMP-binding protein n=1 Tax=Fangia hongkongensis TaxID=270495 RepID=UPI001F3BDEA2